MPGRPKGLNECTTLIYIYIYIYTHTHTHTYMHTCVHAYMHTCIHAYMHADIHTYIHTCMHACMHAYIQRGHHRHTGRCETITTNQETLPAVAEGMAIEPQKNTTAMAVPQGESGAYSWIPFSFSPWQHCYLGVSENRGPY